MDQPDGGGSTAAPIVEVAFSLNDATYPFTGGTRDSSVTYELTDIVPRGSDACAEYFDVTGDRPEHIVETVAEYEDVTANLVSGYGDGGLFEFVVTGNCPAFDLAKRGAIPRTVRGADGTGTIVAEIPLYRDPPEIIQSFLSAYPAAELVGKRRTDRVEPRCSRLAFERVAKKALTDRQREVLEAAFEAGYYEWPRECTGEEVAEELGIASATFSEHVHAAERNLLAVFFDEERADCRPWDEE